MKKLVLSLCFAAFLSAGLVSCTDEAAEITPQNEINEVPYATDDKTSGGDAPTRPKS